MTDPHTLNELFNIAELQASVAELRRDVTRQTERVEEQIATTKELVDAWKAAQALVTFVKWASTLVVALGILWAALRHGLWPTG